VPATEGGILDVRAFALADLPATRALCGRARAADRSVEPFGERLADLATGPRALAQLWRVAEDARGALCGISFAALREDGPARTSVEWYAAVMPACRRGGLGRCLLEPLLSWAKQRSARGPVALRTRVPDVPEARGAAAFLVATGFSQVAVQLSLQHSGLRLPSSRPPPALSVRPLDARDDAALAQFVRLSDDAWEGSPDAFPSREGEAVRLASDAGRLILLAFQGVEAAGYLSGLRLDGALGIDGIAVLPRFRGRGIGRELLLPALRSATGRSPAALLTVREDNLAARALYRSVGFEVSGRRLVFERIMS
jgi:[ribosomal protein S18]-alanine N-acetyltransferase